MIMQVGTDSGHIAHHLDTHFLMGELDLTASVAVVREKAGAVQAGNRAGLEETLTAQAVALDAIFNEMARRAALNMVAARVEMWCRPGWRGPHE
jgi:hypothetical protein